MDFASMKHGFKGILINDIRKHEKYFSTAQF